MRTERSGIGTRIISGAVAALAGGALVFAQESPQVAPAPPPATAENPAGGATPLAATAEPAATPLAGVDQTFLQKAAELHATGAELAKLTEKNAGTEEVQALGQELLAEHTRAIAALREIARSKNFALEASPTATQQATVSEFAGKIGQAFDDTYRAQALSNHEEAILLFANAAKKAEDGAVRDFAERSLGDMKERHASMGGDSVKLKGEMALKLPKPAKSAAKPAAKNEKTAKGTSKTQRATPAETTAPTETAQPAPNVATAPNSAPSSTANRATSARSAPDGNQALIGAKPPGASVVTSGATPRVETPADATTGTSRLTTTAREAPTSVESARTAESAVPAQRRSNSTAGAKAQAVPSNAPAERLEPIIAREPVSPAPADAVTEFQGVPENAVAESPARMPAKARSTTGASRVAPTASSATGPTPDDAAIAAAPVAKVVTRPAASSRSSRPAPPAAAEQPVRERRVIIRQAPTTRAIRIFDDDEDD